MKLDDILPLAVKVPQQESEDSEKVESKTTNESEEGAENDAEDVAEKDVVGGKKKGTRKKRSLNWEEAERGLLVELIKPKVDCMENRSVDAKSIKSKRLAWLHITKQFNALNFRHRALEQIQVQWRSMKNAAKREYQQKQPKSDALDGMRMIEFMEEMQKESVGARSQTRSSGNAIKKELLDLDEDEDMPLAALPSSTNASEDTLQSSTIAIPSPPPSTGGGGDSQQETTTTTTQKPTPTRSRKKAQSNNNNGSNNNSNSSSTSSNNKNKLETTTTIASSPPDNIESGSCATKRKRPNKLNSSSSAQSETAAETTPLDTPSNTSSLQLSVTTSTATTAAVGVSPAAISNTNASTTPAANDDKYKRQLFELMKRARLAEMDYTRREHEQKLRFEQLEQELKLKYYRQQQDLKLRLLRDEHDTRLRHQQAEHEARLRVYTYNGSNRQRCNVNAKVEHNDDNNAAY